RSKRDWSSDVCSSDLVPAQPEGRVGFVATLGGTVEDWVIPHQKLQSTGRGGVGVEYGTLVADEAAKARALGQVADNIRSGGGRRSEERRVGKGGRSQ